MKVALIILISLSVLLQGCGNSKVDNSKDRTPQKKPAELKSTQFTNTSQYQEGSNLEQLERGFPNQKPEVIAAFGIEHQNEGGLYAFYTEQRYFAGVVKKINAFTYQVSGHIGYYQEKNQQISITKIKTTCPSVYGGSKVPTISGSTGDANILVTLNSRSIWLKRVFPSNRSRSLVIHWGCFTDSGRSFYEHRWTDI